MTDPKVPAFRLKKISREGVEAALRKAERYRLLNEAWEAESICRDVLALEPDHQEALITLLLAITDQFAAEGGRRVKLARELASKLEGEYERAYYMGITWERRGTALLRRKPLGWGPIVYDRLRQAMDWYEKAEALRPRGDDSSIVRWNSCARMIKRFKQIRPEPEEDLQPFLE